MLTAPFAEEGNLHTISDLTFHGAPILFQKEDEAHTQNVVLSPRTNVLLGLNLGIAQSVPGFRDLRVRES